MGYHMSCVPCSQTRKALESGVGGGGVPWPSPAAPAAAARFAAEGAPVRNGVRVQSGSMLPGTFGRSVVVSSSLMSIASDLVSGRVMDSSAPSPPRSSQFSRTTSAPPVLSALESGGRREKFDQSFNDFLWKWLEVKRACAYPAKEPPTHANIAGVKAGAFPALFLARSLWAGGGEGLLRTAKYGMRGRRDLYLSYGGRMGRCRGCDEVVAVPGGRAGDDEEENVFEGICACGAASDLIISLWRRGMKPGSIAVPPETRMDEARVLRRSTGT